MALCITCASLGQELAETRPPVNLKVRSVSALHQYFRSKGTREIYVCRSCKAMWLRDLNWDARETKWTQAIVKPGNIIPESRVGPAWNRQRNAP